ncbi:glycosyltransferase [Mucilaginibacter sp.]|uniref:glycosyltransferase n=1 Tax=Mucilaginibacter sp. TaxID=1882438 RepID=UPI002608B003|nr:glycosyltransferase [Mucilaginibacter sp.]MDB4919447.1 glycosyltransferase [Mucilaginibacter sp.]
MKVLLINSFYYPTFVGGAEISVQLLAEGLKRTGNQVYVLTTGPIDRIYRVNGVIVISLKQRNIFSTHNGVANVYGFFKVFWHLIDSFNIFYHFKVSAILKRIQPSLVHTNTIQGFSPFIWLTIKAGKIPLIHTMRDYYLLCHKCSMFNKNQNCDSLCLPCKITHGLKKNLLRYPDHYIGISRYILNRHKAFFEIPEFGGHLIYNAIQGGANVIEKAPADKLHFGYIGRIARDKGVEYLVNEFLNLGDLQKTKIKIVFAGKGEPKFIDQLKNKLQGIEYEFLGIIKPHEFYTKIDILIVPALWNEPFGRTVIESLSHGVPVCQTDRGGLNEIYDPKSSWMYSPKEGNLSLLIDHILKNKIEIDEKKKHCINRAEQFSVDKYIQSHLKLYYQIIAHKAEMYKSNSYSALPNQIE